MQDDYLDCEDYNGHDQSKKYKGFSTFEKEGEFYFAMLDLSGGVRLRSEGYKSEAARNNGVESVLKNRKIRERYSILEEDKKFYLILKAGNHQEIGRSCSYKSKTAARKAMFAWKRKSSSAKKAAHVEDYLDIEAYKGHDRLEKYPDFSTFKVKDEFYFAMLDKDDKVLLRSEGYTKEKSRDNGIESVLKNKVIEKRYVAKRNKGEYFLCLKAGNHQEIGRSYPMESKEAAYLLRDRILGVKSEKAVDDYLECGMYKGHARTEDHPDFSTFSQKDEHYFAMLDKDDEVFFRSEGYTTEKARDNGINSVTKNRDLEKRYSVAEEDGKYFLCLKAGNHQEIARSCSYDSKEKALAAMFYWKEKNTANRNVDDYLTCHLYQGHERLEHSPDFSTFQREGEHYFAMLDKDDEVFFRSEGYSSESAMINGIRSVLKNRELEKRYSVIEDDGKHYLILKAGNHQEIARSCRYDSEAAAMAAMFDWKKKARANVDDYLHCEKYRNHVRSDIHSDFSTFDHEGEHYFAMLDRDGGVILRSEGYTTIKARDNGIQSVLKNREVEGRYSVVQDGHHYFAILKAGNHQEIGRSCPYMDEAAALASMTAWHPYETSEPAPVRREDNYLKCELYKGHGRSAAYPDFSQFEHEGEYYFTFLDKDDEVILRSEGYTTEAARDNGIRSVKKNWEIEERRSVLEKFGHYFVILKAGNHQEIGRSCPKKDEAGALALFGGLAGVGAAAVVPPVVVPPPPPEPEPEPVAAVVPPPVAPEPEPEPVAVVDPVPAAAASSNGCMRFWWLLPLLLLLLLLLWLLMRGCGGETTAVVPPVAPEVKEEVAAETPKEEVAPAPKEEPKPTATVVETGLESIFFDYNKYGLRPKSKQELDKMAKILLSDNSYTGELLAHTDFRGSVEYNTWLSRKRAEAAKNYLIAKGVPESRIKWRNFGENNPIAKNEVNGEENEQGMQYNRRVELRILKAGKDVGKVENIDVPDNLKVK